MAGEFENCYAENCNTSCCVAGYHEITEHEFRGSFREKNIEKLRELGININVKGFFTWYRNCLDENGCKILNNFEGDQRSIICKTHPYSPILELDKNRVTLSLNQCRGVQDFGVSEDYTETTVKLVKEKYTPILGESLEIIVEN